MKTLIFIALKIAELIGLGLVFGLLYLLGKWDLFGFEPGGIFGCILSGFVPLIILFITLLVLAVIYTGLENIIEANKNWTDEIYDKYFKK